MHFAHELKHAETGEPLNLVHRDISPDNILVSRTGAVKVVDFGIAKANTQHHRTKSGVIKGKMAYMPPEQLGRQPMDRRVDIFALGVVFYELVSGSMPFDATSEVSIIQAIMNREPLLPVRARRPDVPDELARIIGRCLEKDREQRYSTCKELQADVEAFIRQSGATVHASDLANLVERVDYHLVPPEAKATPQGPKQGVVIGDPDDVSGLEKTFVREPVGEEAFADTKLSESSPGKAIQEPAGTESPPLAGPSPTALASVRRSRVPIVIAAAGVILVAAGGGWLFAREEPPAPTLPAPSSPVAENQPPVPVPVVPTTPVAVPTPAQPDPPPSQPDPPPEPTKRPERVAKRPDRKKPVQTKPDEPAPAPQQASLEFRVRPYAQVFLDGKPLGQTPFPPVKVAVGRHTIRLVNEKLAKDVMVDFEVKAGEANVFKYNLKK